jgi:hypothetical protein
VLKPDTDLGFNARKKRNKTRFDEADAKNVGSRKKDAVINARAVMWGQSRQSWQVRDAASRDDCVAADEYDSSSVSRLSTANGVTRLTSR